MSGGDLVALIYGLGWLPMFVFRAEAVGESMPHYQGVERRWVRITPLVLTIHITACCMTLSVSSPLSRLGLLAGSTAFAMAITFWFWGRSLISPLRQTRLPDDPPLQFHRDGAFAVVRHPLFSSYILACSAPLFVVPRVYLIMTFLACVFALRKRAVQEEIRLHEQLGPPYAAYCREVKQLVPFLW